MSVALLRDGETWTLRLAGVVDVSEAGALHAAAREVARAAPGVVVADCAGLEALDTSATQVLLALQLSLATTGAVLRLERVPPQVAGLWRQAGLAIG